MYGVSSSRPVVDIVGPSLAKQSFKEECDINNIVSRYKRTGFIEHVAKNTPIYADVSDVTDYQEALDRVREVEGFFDKLPAKIRERFENEPAQFLDFMTNEDNLAEAKELGLVKPEPKPEEVPLVTEPASAGQPRNADGTFK